MNCRHAVALALAFTPAAAVAQAVEVGVSATATYSHNYRECCPPLTWAAFGSGRWRLHVAYLRHYREEDEYSRSHPIDDVDGREATVEQALLRFESTHEAVMLLSWKALARPSYSLNILVGGDVLAVQAIGLVRRHRGTGREDSHPGALSARPSRVRAGVDPAGARPLL